MKLSRTLLLTTLLTGGLSLATLQSASASDITFNFKMKTSGTPTFNVDNSPGNDANDTNNVIRTQDTITYEWEYGINNGAANNVVLRATVPANTEIIVPPVCNPTGSSLTVDPVTGEQTIACALGTLSSGSAGKIDLKARVLGQERAPSSQFVANGNTTTAVGLLTSDNITNTITPITTVPLIISAKPKADLIKDRAYVEGSAVGQDGVTKGLVIRYPISIAVTGGGKGSEALVGPIDFNDLLVFRGGANDGLPIPGTQLYTWRPGYASITPGSNSGCNRMGGDPWAYYGGLPNGKVNSSYYPVYGAPERSTGDSGTWTCTQSGPGQPIQLNIVGADTTGNNAPAKDYAGTTVLPIDKTYLVIGAIHLWVPVSEVTAAGGQLNVRNKVSDFAINGASGAPNVEPTLVNNQYDHTLVSTSGSFTSYYSKSVDARGTPSPGMSGIYSGDGPVMPGQVFAERVYLANNGALPWDLGATLCTAIDNETQKITPLSTAPTSGVKSFSSGTAGVDYVVEYGTGGFATPLDQKKATCDDADSSTGWTTTLPSNPELVTRVRIRALKAVPPGNAFDIALNLTVRNTYLTSGAQIPLGTQLVEHSSFYINGYPNPPRGTAGMRAGWAGGYYNPTTHANTGWGDRMTVMRAVVRVDKQNVPNQPVVNALAGAQVTFVLKPTITAPIPTVVTSPVILKDTLPPDLDYVVGSANVPPTSVINNPDGSQLLTWDFGPRVPGQPLPDITYKANVRLDSANNSTSTNIAVIESPDDLTQLSYRTDKVDVNIGNAASFQIFKEVDKTLIEPNQAVNYRLFYANTGGSDVGTSQFIDILPYGGDGRIPATNFAGALTLNTITGSNNETFDFTSRPHNLINPDPNHVSNQSGGSTQWCTSAQIGVVAGCPSSNTDVTAIRINAPAFPKNTPTRTIFLNMQTNGNTEDNYYTNRFSGRAVGLLSFLQSNDIFAKVKVPPRLLLVKRITAINGVPINTMIDDPTTNTDNHPAWPAGYLKGLVDGGTVKPKDDVEYTIYYLSSGDFPVTNGKFCDRVPSETSFFTKGYNGQTPVAAGATPGSDIGVRFDKANLTEYISGDADGDKGTFFAAGVNPNVTCSGANTNGAITVNMGTVIQAGYGGNPSQAYGLVRFKSKVK